MYDIAILGLGPAGATLARLLRPRFRVIALDKKDHTGTDGFRKPCGGLLATDAQKALSKFNLTLPKDILVDPQIFAVRTVDTKQNLERYYQRFYMNMDRHKFDLWLIGLIPSWIEIVDRSVCLDVKWQKDHYQISYQRGEVAHTIEATYVIGADGANSILRRKLFPQAKLRRYISIQEWYVDQSSQPLYGCFFDADITDCYGWSISKDGYFIFGGAFPVNRNRERFLAWKQKLKHWGYVFGKPVKTEACMVLRPSGWQHCLGSGNAFLLGEAAGLISPSSLEGISYALDSGKILAEVFNSETKNLQKVYRKKMLKLRGKLFLKNFKSLFMYQPFFRKLIMLSKLMSIEVISSFTAKNNRIKL